MFQSFLAGYSTDLNDRILDGLRPSPEDLFDVADIDVPRNVGFHPNDNPSPDMDPFGVYRDENVVVTTTLVVHPPIEPAFAFRFDTDAGSVTISGDTRPSDNLARLAAHTDLLMHEAIVFAWVEATYADQPAAVAQASIDHHRKIAHQPGTSRRHRHTLRSPSASAAPPRARKHPAPGVGTSQHHLLRAVAHR